MAAIAELEPMAKKMGRPKSSERDDATARIDRSVLARAQMVAKARSISVAEYLTEVLREPVGRDFLGEMEKLKGEMPAAKEGRKGSK